MMHKKKLSKGSFVLKFSKFLSTFFLVSLIIFGQLISPQVAMAAPNAPSGVSFAAVGGTVLSNLLNKTNTNFTAGANITAGQATGGSAELLKDGVSFSTPIMDSSISAGDTSVTFSAGFSTNSQVQNAFASGATISVKLTDSSNNSTTSTTSSPVSLGDAYGGGKVFYILQAGDPGYDANVQKGFISPTVDQSTGIIWHIGGTASNATATAIGSGATNTSTIVSAYGSESNAAKLCYDSTYGGYSDWHLPSKDELNKLFQNKAYVGSFSSSEYFTSTEYNAWYAWKQNMGSGDQYQSGDKESSRYVRCVRPFTIVSNINPVITVDYVAPDNQDTVFSADVFSQNQTTVSITSSGVASNNIWFAPSGTTVFTEGTTMTKASSGTATSILSPSDEGIYKLYVVDLNGNPSDPSTHTLTIDRTAPTPTKPIGTAQVLKSGATSTSTVQINEAGKIYLVKNGTASSTQGELDSAVTAHTAFVGVSSASASTSYTVTLPAGLIDGVYNIVGVDLTGNISSPLAGWLTVDNTLPTSAITSPSDGALVNSQTVISGTATDTNTISSVQISIKRLSDNKWWNGSSFTPTTETFVNATGTNSWSYAISDSAWTSNTSYLIKSKATDVATNVENVGSGNTFTIDNLAPVSVIVSPGQNGNIKNLTSITGTATDVGTITLTEVSIKRLSDNKWWNGSSFTPTTETFVNATGTNSWSYAISNDAWTTNTSYLIKVRSTDDGNNTETPGAGTTFFYDETSPSVTITAICDVAGNGCTPVGENATPQEAFRVLSLSGTSLDSSGSGVNTIEISIKDTNTNNWYSGSSFSDGTETYLPGTGTTSWTFDSSNISLIIDHVYDINIKATDYATNSQIISLSFKFTNAPPVVSNVTASQGSDGTVAVTYDVTDVESTQTTNYLFYGVNTTLSNTISESSSSLSVTSGTYLPASGTIMIDDEIISYTSKSGGTLSGLTRGAMSTTPIAHTAGASVYVYATSATGNGIGLSNKGTGKNISWVAREDADSYESLTGIVRVVANDGAAGSMIGATNSSSFSLDAKKPTATITFDAGIAGVSNSATITIPKPTDISAVEYKIRDDESSQTNPATTGWVSITENTTIPWTFDSDVEVKSLKYQFRDNYGNVSAEQTASTHIPVSSSSFMVQDTSNVSANPPYYDLYIGWQATTAEGFSSYRLEQSTSSDGATYSAYSNITNASLSDVGTNYYIYRDLDPDLYYKFRLGVINTEGNISVRSNSSITTKPDGVQNFGEGGGGSVLTASKVENVVVTQNADKTIGVEYMLTDSSYSKKLNPSYEAYLFYNIGITLPTNALSGETITVSDASKLKSSGYIQINNEVIKYTGKTGNTLTGIVRSTWPTSVSSGRATRTNTVLFAGTPVWIMANGTTPVSITNETISAGQNGTINWDTYNEIALMGNIYNNVGIKVLVHDNQDVLSGPLSSQNDYSEIGILNTFDLSAPAVSFNGVSGEGDEETTPVVVTINLARAYPLDTTVDYALSGTAGLSDYNLDGGVATIVAGQTSTTIEIPVLADTLKESNETVIITLSSPTNAVLGSNTSYTYTITDNDSLPTISFEGTSGTGAESVTPVNIPVTLSAVSGVETSASYSVSGTATGSGADYTLTNGTVTIPAGQTTSNISLNILEDLISEQGETVIVTLSNSTGADLGMNTVYTYTIEDNDQTPLFGFTETSSSGLESVTSASIPVSIPVTSTKDISVNYAVTGGTATSNADFVLASGTASILAGNTSVNIPLTIVNDTLKESNETVIITLSSPTNATLGANTSYTYTILDNETDITISFANSVSTGLENASEAILGINLSSVSSLNVSVDYSVSGTATSEADYSLASGTVTIQAGNTSANLTASIINDSIYELGETIIVTLSNPVNATLGSNTIHTYTILDNESIPVVSFTNTTQSGLEDVSSVSIPVSVSPASYQNISVDYVISGTATSTDDFTLASGTATIEAGSTSVNIPLTIVNDTLKESNETVIVTLSNPVNSSLGTNTIYTYTITDNDTASTVEFSQVSVSNTENVASVNVPVVLAEVSGTDVTLNYQVSGSASGADDFSLSNGTVTIVAGETSANINLLITNDTRKEESETVIITLTSATGATLGSKNIYTYTIVDNDTYPTLAFDSLTSQGREDINSGNILVTLSSAYPEDVTFRYAVTGGSAEGAGIDYLIEETSGTITAGSTNVNIPVVIFDDDTSEETENIIITISNPTKAVLGEKVVHAFSILDNEILITEINGSSVKSTSARISWTTADYTDSLIEYGTIPGGQDGAYALSKQSLDKVLDHSVYLDNLTPETTYYFKTTSENLAGEITVSESEFTTTPGPIITNVSDSNPSDTGITITWATNIPATSHVSYSTDSNLASPSTVGSNELVTDHSVTLTGLVPGSIYYYLVTSVDESNNAGESANGGSYYDFNTNGDETAPVISEVSVPIKTSTQVAVVWITNELANGLVRYGTSSGEYDNATDLIYTLVTNHLATINELEESTQYYYVIESADENGNKTISDEYSFETPSVEKVVITKGGGGIIGVAQELYDIILAENQAYKAKYSTMNADAPIISNIEISDVTAFNATISFQTNEDTVSFIKYGKDKEYGQIVADDGWSQNHSIKLTGLSLGSEYNFKISAMDKSNDTGYSDNQTFTTRYLSEDISELQKIDNVEQFQAEIESTIESILPSLAPPFIGKPEVSNITENSATIKFKTNIRSYPIVSYTSDANFDASRTNPYDGEMSDSSEKRTNHEINLMGLKSNTKYHFIVKAFSLPQVIGKSEDFTFTTSASKIQASVIDVKKDTFTVVWYTDEPASSIVEYKNVKTGRISRIVDDSKNTSHSVKIENLTPGTPYELQVSGLNEKGNLIESTSVLNVKTSTDNNPPEITNLKVDSALVTGRTDRVQTIISWQTDEPATSSVYYQEGSGSLKDELSNKQEDSNFTKNHVVILTVLKPGTVYRFTVSSTDDAGNTVKPPIRTIITPKKTESIVDVIFKNFDETFDFINNVR